VWLALAATVAGCTGGTNDAMDPAPTPSPTPSDQATAAPGRVVLAPELAGSAVLHDITPGERRWTLYQPVRNDGDQPVTLRRLAPGVLIPQLRVRGPRGLLRVGPEGAGNKISLSMPADDPLLSRQVEPARGAVLLPDEQALVYAVVQRTAVGELPRRGPAQRGPTVELFFEGGSLEVTSSVFWCASDRCAFPR